jgi:hypothetical protein
MNFSPLTRLSLGLLGLTIALTSAQTATASTPKKLPVTDYQDIRNFDSRKQFTPCPTDTILLRFAETTKYKVQICSQEGDLSLPGYYMGQGKNGGGNLKFKIRDQQAAQTGVYKHEDYSYILYTDGLHRDGFRPKLQVYGPKAKLLLEEQLLSLYDKDYHPIKPPVDKPVSQTVNLESIVPKLKATKIPILLPKPFKLVYEGQVSVFPSATADSYNVGLAAAPDCGGANACTIGNISGQRVKPGELLPYKNIVNLTNGIKGSYKPLTCGASCSPPDIVWIKDNVMYSIQLKGTADRSDDKAVQSAMTAIANSAIQTGPR